jgi:AcrR family transcriptional regulator
MAQLGRRGVSPLPLRYGDEHGAIMPHERLLAVASQLFCRDGIHATGIERVLQESGVSRMTLYNRFGSKEALVFEVLQREGAAWRAWFFDAVADAGPAADARLRSIVPVLRFWFSREEFYGCAFVNAVAEHSKGDPKLREAALAHQAEIVAYMTGLATDAGYANPSVVAKQIMLLIDGATVASLVSGDPAVIDMADLTLGAILTAAPKAQAS